MQGHRFIILENVTSPQPLWYLQWPCD